MSMTTNDKILLENSYDEVMNLKRRANLFGTIENALKTLASKNHKQVYYTFYLDKIHDGIGGLNRALRKDYKKPFGPCFVKLSEEKPKYDGKESYRKLDTFDTFDLIPVSEKARLNADGQYSQTALDVKKIVVESNLDSGLNTKLVIEVGRPVNIPDSYFNDTLTKWIIYLKVSAGMTTTFYSGID